MHQEHEQIKDYKEPPSFRTSTSPARNNRLANSCSLAEACLWVGIWPFAFCKDTRIHTHTSIYTRITHAHTPVEAKVSKIYYSPRGYWKGLAAVKKLAAAARASEDVTKKWLAKQTLWQIYLPAPRYISRPKFDVSSPNASHQADLLFLPQNKLPRGRKIYRYALTVVNVASRYKAAEPLASKESEEVSRGFARIYSSGPLKWPQLLQVDRGAGASRRARDYGGCYKDHGEQQNSHSPRTH